MLGWPHTALFIMSELKSWIAENLLTQHHGRDVPREFEFRVTYSPPPIESLCHDEVPPQISLYGRVGGQGEARNRGIEQ